MAQRIACRSLVTVMLLLVGSAALAQTDYPPPGQLPRPTTTQRVPWARAARFRMDCGQDLHRFCYGVQPGEGRLIQCLLSHRSQLSSACVSHVAATQPALGMSPSHQNKNTQSPRLGQAVTDSALRASCGPDVQRLCARVSRANGDVIRCLSSRRMELSPTCDAFFKVMPPRRAAQKGAPGNDVPPSPNTTPRVAKGRAAMPAAPNSPVDTGAPPAANGTAATPAAAGNPVDRGGTPPVATGPAETGASAAANAAEAETGASAAAANAPEAKPAVANSPQATPAAANGSAETGASGAVNGPDNTPAAANGPEATHAAADGSAETGAPAAANGPATTRAPPAANNPPAKDALPFPL